MKVLGLNGRTYNVNLDNYLVRRDSTMNRSQYHLRAREILRDMFKGYSIFEEVKLPGSRDPSKKSTLFLDFLIPNMDIAVEVHGQQHYEFSRFFHKTRAGYREAQRRDAIKAEWCEVNDLDLIVLKYSDSVDQWRSQIAS